MVRYQKQFKALTLFFTFSLGVSCALAGPRLKLGSFGEAIARSIGNQNDDGRPWEGISESMRLPFGELQKCVQQQTRLGQADLDLKNQETALRSTKAALEQMRGRVQRSELQIDLQSEHSVNAHNSLVDTYQREWQTYKTMIDRFNSHVVESNAEADAFNNNCAGKRYQLSDMEVIKNGRK